MSFINLIDLLEETDKLTDWFTFGVFLKMPSEDLKDIENRYSTAGLKRCKIELFTLWLQRNPNASWDQIAQALEKCDQIAIADRIRKCYLSLSSSAPAGRMPPCQEENEACQQPVQQVQLDIPRDKVVKFRQLESSYAQLASSLKISVIEKSVPLLNIRSFLEELLNDRELSRANNIDELFHLISPHYCFLNTSILGDIIEKFVGEPLKHELEKYERQLNKFKKSISMALLKEFAPQSLPSVGAPQVTIKLTRCWSNVTIERFQKLVEHIFKENSVALANVHVKPGCICITWLARRSAIPSLKAQAHDNIEFMKLVGVIRMSVAGIDILKQEEEEDTFFSSALVRAAHVDSVDAVKTLLSLKADPNSSDGDGLTPLMIACIHGNIRIVTLLLQEHANINQQNNYGNTALMEVCLSETPHNELVRLLIQSGADVNTKSSKLQRTALMYAAQRGHTSIVRYLLDKAAPVNTQDVDGATSLMIASQFGCSEIVRVLLDYRANVNELAWSEEFYQTALMFACAFQRTVCVDILIAGGADPNLCSRSYSPLIAACITGHDQPMDPTILDKLLSAGANPNTQTGQYGNTALIVASQYGYDKGVHVLLNRGADANIQNFYGNTSLHYVANEGHLGICKMLLVSGARASLTNSYGNTPLDIARHYGNHLVCELLCSCMDSDPTATQEKITKPVQHSSQSQKFSSQDQTTTWHSRHNF